MVISLFFVCFLAVLTGFASSKSLHLPGVSPTSYNSNDPVKVYRLLTLLLTYFLTHSFTYKAICDQVDFHQDTNSL